MSALEARSSAGATSATGQPACAEARHVVAGMMRLSRLATDAAGWTAGERREVLRLLDRTVDGLAAVRAAVLVAERESGAWQGAGDRSFEAWRERTARTSRRTATSQVRQAGHLGTVPTVAAAVTDGRISLEHAESIAKVAATGTPEQREAVTSASAQAHLLSAAQEQDAGQFALTVDRWAATVDADGLERDHEAQRAQRYFNVTTTPRGTYLKGRLDTIAGHRLTLALEALTPRPAAEDDRDPGQRRADALDAMAGRILAQSDTKPGGHVPPQITMLVTAETWAAARAIRDRRRQGPRALPAATPSGEPRSTPYSSRDDASASYKPATLEDGTPVPVSELAAAMCDCEITRVVLDADSTPVDLGRTQRLYTGPQRRAVIARDRECAWPDCHAHARWCDVHHITWWERDFGPTSVDNAVLLCSYHHHEVHRRDLAISRLPRHGRAKAPPGADAIATAAGRTPSAVATFEYVFTDRTGRTIPEVQGGRLSGAGRTGNGAPAFGPGGSGGPEVPGDREGSGGPGRTGDAPPSGDGQLGPVVLPQARTGRRRRTATRSSADPPAAGSAEPVKEGVPDELDLSMTSDP